MTDAATPTVWDPATRRRIQRDLDRLRDEFAGIFSAETIERYVADSTAQLATARNTTYLPLFVERFARERLCALAQAQGSITKTVPEVLFICVHNAGRSQMAAALLDHHAQGRAHVRSAGSTPADQLNPAVVTAMAEIGLDISQRFPKPLTDEVAQAADVVITMGCGDACPIYPGKRYLDWDLPDPDDQPLDTVRAIRNDIDQRVQALLSELAGA
jgi:protein-tyrosine-phosphatase